MYVITIINHKNMNFTPINWADYSWLIVVIVVLAVWEAVWKGVGLWKAGRNGQLKWFVCMFILNTAGILPIVYIKFFQKKSFIEKILS